MTDNPLSIAFSFARSTQAKEFLYLSYIFFIWVSFEFHHSLFYVTVMRYVNHPEYKEFIGRLSISIVNVRAIVRHFRPKIDDWTKENNTTTLTEEEVCSANIQIY